MGPARKVFHVQRRAEAMEAAPHGSSAASRKTKVWPAGLESLTTAASVRTRLMFPVKRSEPAPPPTNVIPRQDERLSAHPIPLGAMMWCSRATRSGGTWNSVSTTGRGRGQQIARWCGEWSGFPVKHPCHSGADRSHCAPAAAALVCATRTVVTKSGDVAASVGPQRCPSISHCPLQLREQAPPCRT